MAATLSLNAAAPAPAAVGEPALTRQPELSPAVRAALAHAASQNAAARARDDAAVLAARDAAAQRAKLLAARGYANDAARVLAAAPPPPPARLAPPSSGSLSLARYACTAPSAPLVARGLPAAPSPRLDWVARIQGSIAGAAALPAPDAAAVLTPVQVAVEGVAELPPGEQCARQQALYAASKLVPYMSLTMAAKVLGCPAAALAARPQEYVAAEVIHTVG